MRVAVLFAVAVFIGAISPMARAQDDDALKAQGWERLSGTQLEELVSDVTQNYTMSSGTRDPGLSYFSPDRSAKINHNNGGFVSKGKWWIDGDVWCVRWRKSKSDACQVVYGKGGAYKSFIDGNLVVDWTVTPGDKI